MEPVFVKNDGMCPTHGRMDYCSMQTDDDGHGNWQGVFWYACGCIVVRDSDKFKDNKSSVANRRVVHEF